MRRVAILLAAGKGERMQGGTQDKILHPLCGQPVFTYSVSAFLRSGLISDWVVVHRDEQQKNALQNAMQVILPESVVTFVVGGKERKESVWLGLQAVAPEVDFVFIHDCARPLLRAENVRRLAQMAESCGAAVLVHRIHDTVRKWSLLSGGCVAKEDILPEGGVFCKKHPLRTSPKKLLFGKHFCLQQKCFPIRLFFERFGKLFFSSEKKVFRDKLEGLSGTLFEEVNREDLLAMETPQVFGYKGIFEAYRKVVEERYSVTDDVGAWLRMGRSIGVVANEWPNVKLTTPKDILLLESMIKGGFYE